MGMAEVAEKLTESDKRLLSYFEQCYLINGMLPSRDACVKAGYGGVLYDKALRSQAFLDALARRGVRKPDAPVGILSEEQLVAANVMLDLTDNRSRRKKLQELGISTQKWEGWLRDQTFQHYLRTRSENMLGDNLHESHLALVDRVRSGDISAIKYFNEITGRYVPASNEKVDVNGVLMRVLEIIQRHVKEPEVLQNIAAEFMHLADTSQIQQRPTVILQASQDSFIQGNLAIDPSYEIPESGFGDM